MVRNANSIRNAKFNNFPNQDMPGVRRKRRRTFSFAYASRLILNAATEKAGNYFLDVPKSDRCGVPLLKERKFNNFPKN
jgi:hypothetical protein